MLRQALFEVHGPVAVRYPRGGEGRYREDHSEADVVRLRDGGDVTLVGYGVQINHLLDAADRLAAEGIEAEVIKLNRISPLDGDTLCEMMGCRRVLLVLEDSFGSGCIGQQIAALLAQRKQAPERLILKNLENAPGTKIPSVPLFVLSVAYPESARTFLVISPLIV